MAVGCGPNVDDEVLKAISTSAAFRMSDSAAAFVALFNYLSQSIAQSAQAGSGDDPFAGLDQADDDILMRIP